MTPDEYIEKALRTESKDYQFEGIYGVTPRMEHAIMGIVTEGGELMDDVKKAKIYHEKIDKKHIIEEAGDVMWYLAILADSLGISFEEIWEANINKLKARYPKKYSDFEAVNRDLDKEKQALGNVT